MKISCTIAFLFMIVISYGQTQSECDVIDNFVRDDSGIYVEKKSADNANPDRYTVDNKVYRINRKFIFDYYIIREGDTLKIKVPQTVDHNTDFQRAWSFVSAKANDIDKIKTISLTCIARYYQSKSDCVEI